MKARSLVLALMIGSSPFMTSPVLANSDYRCDTPAGVVPLEVPGNVFVSSGASCDADGSSIGGNVIVETGAIHFGAFGMTLNGSLIVQPDVDNVAIFGSGINGNVQVDEIDANLTLSSNIVGGSVQIRESHADAPVFIAGNAIHGNVDILHNTGVVTLGVVIACSTGNFVAGYVKVEGNSGEVDLSCVFMASDLLVSENSFVFVVLNSVVQNVQLSNNDAVQALQNLVGENFQVVKNDSAVLNTNTIGDTLQCWDNAVIFGEGNTAEKTEGQCQTLVPLPLPGP